MIINSVTLSNYSEILNSIIFSNYDKKLLSQFKHELFTVYSRINLSFDVSDLSPIEVFQIKSSLGGIISTKDIYTKNFMKQEEYPDLYESIDNMIELSVEISNDEDVKPEFNLWEPFLPIGTKRYDVYIIFSGVSLMNFLTTDPIQFLSGFLKKDLESNGESFISNGNEEEYIDIDKLNNELAKKLYEGVYKDILNSISDVDVLAQIINEETYFKKVKNERKENQVTNVIMNQVISPVGMLNFFQNDKSRFVDQLKNLKSYINGDYGDTSNVYFYFTLISSFDVFLDFYLNTDFVNTHEPIKMLIDRDMEENIPDVILRKYNKRIIDVIKIMKNITVTEKRLSLIEILNFISCGTKICYIIKFPLGTYISNKSIFFDKLIMSSSVKEDSSESNEIGYIINEIIKSIKSILSFVNK